MLTISNRLCKLCAESFSDDLQYLRQKNESGRNIGGLVYNLLFLINIKGKSLWAAALHLDMRPAKQRQLAKLLTLELLPGARVARGNECEGRDDGGGLRVRPPAGRRISCPPKHSGGLRAVLILSVELQFEFLAVFFQYSSQLIFLNGVQINKTAAEASVGLGFSRYLSCL